MDTDLTALARCVGDVEAFTSRFWGRAPMVRRRAGSFVDLLDLDAIDTLLTSTSRRPTFRVVRDGDTIAAAEVTTSLRLGGTTLDDVADVGRIGARLADGATLVLQGLQRTWPPLIGFSRALERATSHPVQVNAYLTPRGAAGLGEHADGHHVLVLQVLGTKRWHVDGLGELDLDPGDVLYLPRGRTHSAAAQAGTSLHLTVGLLADTYRGVVSRALAAVDALDAPLPIGWARSGGRSDLGAGLQHAFVSASRQLAAAAEDLDDVVTAEVDRARQRRRPLLTGHLRSVLADVDDETVVRCRPDNPAMLDDDGDHVVLRLVDRTVRIPAHVRPALEVLLERGQVRVGDLIGLGAPGRAVLVRRLIREGLLEVMPPGAPG